MTSFINVDSDKCTSCGICADSCTFNAITIGDCGAEIDQNCTFCKACIIACDFNALTENPLAARKNSSKDYSQYSGVWVFAEQKAGKVANVTYELLGEGRRLADKLGVRLTAVIAGNNVSKISLSLIHHGADTVYEIEDDHLNHYEDILYTDILVKLIEKYKPEILMVGATTIGRSLAPRVAARLETGLTADCTKLDVDLEKRLLLQTRPAFGGNLMATIVCPEKRPQMCSVRPRVMKALEPDIKRVGEIIRTDIKIQNVRKCNILNSESCFEEKVNLCEADVVVAVGRGIGTLENINRAKELAELLGGTLAASRAVVDLGWVEYARQVGQTGRTVAPKLYLAFGISGAIQHVAGMSSADNIIAINKDPNASIFKVANVGIVGDVQEVLPSLINELKKKRKADY